jgi:hypothetical protein
MSVVNLLSSRQTLYSRQVQYGAENSGRGVAQGRANRSYCRWDANYPRSRSARMLEPEERGISTTPRLLPCNSRIRLTHNETEKVTSQFAATCTYLSFAACRPMDRNSDLRGCRFTLTSRNAHRVGRILQRTRRAERAATNLNVSNQWSRRVTL